MDIRPLPVKKPRPSFYSRLFSRNRPLASDHAGVLADGFIIPDPPIAGPTSLIDEDEGTLYEYDGDAVEETEDHPEDED